MNKMKVSSKIYSALIFIFLFAPILVLLVFSFNEAKSLSVFSGFSLKWYKELFNDRNTLEAVRNTLILALSATVVSTIMGTAAALGIDRLRSRWYRRVMDTVTDIPMINPEIITGISLMLMFVFVGRLFGASNSLSFWTMLIAHVTFCTPYVIMQVLPKLQQMPSCADRRRYPYTRRYRRRLQHRSNRSGKRSPKRTCRTGRGKG